MSDLRPPAPCDWVVAAHAGPVTALVIGPAGDLVTGGADGKVRRWSRDGALLAEGGSGVPGVRGLAWSGERLVVVGDDGASVLDARLAVLEAHALPDLPAHVAAGHGVVVVALRMGALGALVPGVGFVPWRVGAQATSLLAVEAGFAWSAYDRWELLGPDGAVLRGGSLDALAQGRPRGGHLRPHPDGRRVLAVVEGEEMELYTTTALVLIEPLEGAVAPCEGWDALHVVAPWVGPDGAPLYVVGETPAEALAGRALRHGRGTAVAQVVAVDATGLVVTGGSDGRLRRWRWPIAPGEPLAGRIVGVFRGELWTWEAGPGRLHAWSLEDGRWLRSERPPYRDRQRFVVAADGEGLIRAAPATSGGEDAQLARWSQGAEPWATPKKPACRGVVVAAAGTFGAREVNAYRLRAVDLGSARMTGRSTPHLSWGGAVGVAGRAVSWDQAGRVCGWAAGAVAWTVELGGPAYAGADAGDGTVAMLASGAGGLWVAWLDAVTGEERARTGPSRVDLATRIVVRADGAVVSEGAVPALFARGGAPGRSVGGARAGYHARLHQGGRFALSMAHDGARAALDLDAGRATPVEGARGDVSALYASLGPGGDARMACTLRDGEVAVVDLASARVVRSWRAHDGALRALEADARGERLFTVGGGRARIWDARTGELLGDWPGPSQVDSAGFVGEQAAVWGYDASWLLRRYAVGEASPVFEAPVARASADEELADPRWALVGASELVVHDLSDGREVARVVGGAPGGESSLLRGAVSDDGQRVLVAKHGFAERVDVASGDRRAVDPAWTLGGAGRFLPGDRALVVAVDGVRVLDAATGALRVRVPLPPRVPFEVAADGAWLWAAVDGGVQGISLADGAAAWAREAPGAVLRAGVSGDVLVGSATGEVLALDGATGEVLARWAGTEAVADLADLDRGRVCVVDAAGRVALLSR